MLDRIGAVSLDDLFDEIPESLRITSLTGVPDALPEMDVARLAYFSLFSRVNYGIRYVLPVLPLLMVWAARLVPWVKARGRAVSER